MGLDFSHKYILENDAVLLRPIEASDRELLMDFAVNEPEIWRFNANGGNGRENFERYFARALKQFAMKRNTPLSFSTKNSRNTWA